MKKLPNGDWVFPQNVVAITINELNTGPFKFQVNLKDSDNNVLSSECFKMKCRAQDFADVCAQIINNEIKS